VTRPSSRVARGASGQRLVAAVGRARTEWRKTGYGKRGVRAWSGHRPPVDETHHLVLRRQYINGVHFASRPRLMWRRSASSASIAVDDGRRSRTHLNVRNISNISGQPFCYGYSEQEAHLSHRDCAIVRKIAFGKDCSRCITPQKDRKLESPQSRSHQPL